MKSLQTTIETLRVYNSNANKAINDYDEQLK